MAIPTKPMTGDELRKMLERADVSQIQLAEMLGVEKGTVNRWVLGKLPIKKSSAIAIRSALAAK
jgi:transcriptional regulator with XRE-family HTH domain